MKQIKVISLLIISCFICVTAFADTITLKSGRKIDGEILERADDSIKINFEGAEITYFMEDIDEINGEKIKIKDYPNKTTAKAGVATDESEEDWEYKFEEKKKDFEEALKINPNSTKDYIGLFNAYLGLKQYDKAKELFEKAKGKNNPELILLMQDTLNPGLEISEAAGEAAVTTVCTAMEVYSGGNYGKYPFSIDELINADPPYLHPKIKNPLGYVISFNSTGDNYEVTATPISCGFSGRKVFRANKDGVVSEAECK